MSQHATDTTTTHHYDTADGTVTVHEHQLLTVTPSVLDGLPNRVRYALDGDTLVVVGFTTRDAGSDHADPDLEVNTPAFDLEHTATIPVKEVVTGNVEPQTTPNGIPKWGY